MEVFYCKGKVGIYGYKNRIEIVIGDVNDELEQNPYAIPSEVFDMETSELVKELGLINPMININLEREGINEEEFKTILEKAKEEKEYSRLDIL